ncbi:MAG: hypothetical protein WDW38_009591 [Sanguina aurantia]
MGQFASTAFNGDPYVDIMREMPDREIVWWVQKVIWIAEGWTFVQHAARTYPTLFLHKCACCHGAGCVICPHCEGRKLLSGGEGNDLFRLPQRGPDGRALANADVIDCRHCGPFCEWDQESEWQDNFQQWDRRLKYYDRTYGPLFDEWNEDIANAGNLVMDDKGPDEKWGLPSEDRDDIVAQMDRELFYDGKRLEALVKYFKGHPYDTEMMLGYRMVDPTISIGHNVQTLLLNDNSLPPDLKWEQSVENEATRVAQIAMFDNQILQQSYIMNNLDAAIKGERKPVAFEPTAGTVPCPDCQGDAWAYSFLPNLQHLTRTETPFWNATLSRMAAYWTPPGQLPSIGDGGASLERTRRAQIVSAIVGGVEGQGAGDGYVVGAAAVTKAAEGSGRLGGEYGPLAPVNEGQIQDPAVLFSGRNTSTQQYRPQLNRMLRGPERFDDPAYMFDYGSRLVPDPADGNDPGAASSNDEWESAVRELDDADRNALRARSQHPLVQEFRPEQLRQQQHRRPAHQYGLDSEEAAAEDVPTSSGPSSGKQIAGRKTGRSKS